MKILYDCSGGDNAPEAIIKGALLAKEKLAITPFFVGDSEVLEKLLSVEDQKFIIHANEVIENTDEPAIAIRKKTNSSIVVGMKSLLTGQYTGMVSAGSTGGLLAGGLFILKRISGVNRAALPVILPGSNGMSMIMDVGANMDTSPELLVSFAKMGSIYLENIYEITNPKVALLNVGLEKGKGDKRSQQTYELLEKSSLNFIGNIEAREIFLNRADLIITDGFSGNILLKTTEGVVGFVLSTLKNAVMNIEGEDDLFKMKMGAFIKESLSHLDYNNYGGVPLLGIRYPIIKAHGSSDERAILSATQALKEMHEKKVIEKLSNMEV